MLPKITAALDEVWGCQRVMVQMCRVVVADCLHCQIGAENIYGLNLRHFILFFLCINWNVNYT